MNYGLLELAQDVRAYILGESFKMPSIPYQEDGNWEPYLPKYEPQRENFETYGCTVWGTQNAIETLHKRLYNQEPNYSERFTALLSGLTGKKGTDPHVPCESIRNDGMVDNDLMPMTNSKADFFDPSRITGSLRAKGLYWLEQHQFMHEWLWVKRPENWKEVLKESLKTSPIGVSVSAWKEVGGVYVSDQGNVNNHWCLLYHIDEEGYMYVFDSYDHNKKKLAKDHNIRRAKRFWLNKLTVPALKKHKSLLELILKRLMKPDLLDVCEAHLGKDASPADLAPDELGCAETVTTLLKKVHPATPILTGTYSLYDYLRNPKNGYVPVNGPTPGTIIICATTPGHPFPGHVGIFQADMTIASNDSKTGKFIKNYDLQTWRERYEVKGHYKIYLYKHV